MIKLKLNFISNYNPYNPSNINKNNLVSKKILCKNFILFILFLNFFKFSKLSIFIKPKFKKKIMILNAPYRYKLSKSQFFFSRFNILLNFDIKNDIKVNSTSNLVLLFKNLFFFFKKFNINICHQDYLKIFFKFNFKKNFLISNYK